MPAGSKRGLGLLHHCHVIQIDGRSFRMKEIEKRGSPRA
jgi:hypothetical protein